VCGDLLPTNLPAFLFAVIGLTRSDRRNSTFRKEGIQIQNFDLGVKVLVSLSTNAVLMCECADQKICHRLFIVRQLRRKGFKAEESGDWKGG
jgi:hypothetical protein